jgi:hypothetical protein
LYGASGKLGCSITVVMLSPYVEAVCCLSNYRPIEWGTSRRSWSASSFNQEPTATASRPARIETDSQQI